MIKPKKMSAVNQEIAQFIERHKDIPQFVEAKDLFFIGLLKYDSAKSGAAPFPLWSISNVAYAPTYCIDDVIFNKEQFLDLIKQKYPEYIDYLLFNSIRYL